MTTNGSVDAIGETVFSETFVLKTLIQLTEVSTDSSKWTDSLEQDLSGLWDMSGYEDVAMLLVENNFLGIVYEVLSETEPDIPRMMEQVLGIVANMCSVKGVQIRISRRSDLLYLLIQMLACSDALTLVQLVRLLTVLLKVISTSDCAPLETAEMKVKETKRREAERVNRRLMGLGVSLIAINGETSATPESIEIAGNKIANVLLPHFARDGEGMDRLIFILKSSSHTELIVSTVKLVHILCHLDVNDGELFGVHCASEDLVQGLVIAGTQLTTREDENEENEETECQALVELVEVLEVLASQAQTRQVVCNQGPVVMAALVKYCECHWRQLMVDTITIFEVLLKETSLVSDTALATVLSVSKKVHQGAELDDWDQVCEDEREEAIEMMAIQEKQLPYLHDLWLLNQTEPFLDETQASEIAAILLAENIIEEL